MVHELGYPCRKQEQKREAVIALCTRTGDANTIAQDYGVTREALCNLKNNLLGEGESITMPKEEDPPPMTVDTLLSEIETSSSRSAG